METEAAKLIAAGLAVAPLLGAAVGLGVLFSGIVNSMARNPSMLSLIHISEPTRPY